MLLGHKHPKRQGSPLAIIICPLKNVQYLPLAVVTVKYFWTVSKLVQINQTECDNGDVLVFQQKRQTATATRSSRKSTRRAPADSSQEEGRQGSKAMTPESQSFLPGSESGGFSVALSGTKKKGSSSSLGSPDKTAQQQTMTSRTRRKSDGMLFFVAC